MLLKCCWHQLWLGPLKRHVKLQSKLVFRASLGHCLSVILVFRVLPFPDISFSSQWAYLGQYGRFSFKIFRATPPGHTVCSLTCRTACGCAARMLGPPRTCGACTYERRLPAVSKYSNVLSSTQVKSCNMKYFGHISRHTSLEKNVILCPMPEKRSQRWLNG